MIMGNSSFLTWLLHLTSLLYVIHYHHFMVNGGGDNRNSDKTLFSWAPKSLQTVTSAMKLKDTCSLEENYDTPRQCIKRQTHHLADRGPHSQRYGFSSSHVWMWELDHKEDWAPKNWCFWTVVLEKTLESPLDCKEIKPADSKVNQPWVFIGKNEAESEASIL